MSDYLLTEEQITGIVASHQVSDFIVKLIAAVEHQAHIQQGWVSKEQLKYLLDESGKAALNKALEWYETHGWKSPEEEANLAQIAKAQIGSLLDALDDNIQQVRDETLRTAGNWLDDEAYSHNPSYIRIRLSTEKLEAFRRGILPENRKMPTFGTQSETILGQSLSVVASRRVSADARRKEMLRDEICQAISKAWTDAWNNNPSVGSQDIFGNFLTRAADAVIAIPEFAEDHRIAEAWRSQNANPDQAAPIGSDD